jgi:signal peptidase I
MPAPVFVAGNPDDPPLNAWADEKPPSQTWPRLRHLGWEFTQTLVLALVIFLAVRAMAQNFRVEGSSMEPGLHDGQYLLVNKAIYFRINLDKVGKYLPFIDGGDQPERFLFRAPRRGDVIVFSYPRDPSRDFIKRVIAVPGDTIDFANGNVLVNGVQLAEPYIIERTDCRGAECHIVVPDKHYFVLGDNRNNSSDSRSWGFVPEENIIGQAMLSYWPFSELGGVGNYKIDLGFVTIGLP